MKTMLSDSCYFYMLEADINSNFTRLKKKKEKILPQLFLIVVYSLFQGGTQCRIKCGKRKSLVLHKLFLGHPILERKQEGKLGER